MAGLVSKLLLLAIQYMTLCCAKRTFRCTYSPYGIEMCRVLCKDSPDKFLYRKDVLLCSRVSSGNSCDSKKKDKRVGHAAGKMDVSNRNSEGKNPSTKQTGLATESMYSGDLKAVKYNCARLTEICKTGTLSLVKHVISNGLGDINCQTKKGYTPVMMAVQGHQIKVVEYLVSQGCDLSPKNQFKNDVIHLACVEGIIDMVKCLVNSGNCNLETGNFMGRTPMIQAASLGFVEILELFVKAGCNLKAVDDMENNALHVACMHGKVDSVKYLLTLGAAKKMKKMKNMLGRTPLQEAQIRSHITIIRLLNLEKKENKRVRRASGSPDVSKRNSEESIHSEDLKAFKYSCTKLTEICKTGKLKLVEHMISNGLGDINCQNNNGYTPVMMAVYGHQVKVAEYLVGQGCDLSPVNKLKNNVLHLACLMKNIDIVQTLLDTGKCDLESENLMGQTPVIIAAFNGNTKILELLVKGGCDPKAGGSFGTNALHVACMCGKVDTVRYLITLTAAREMMKMKNKSGRTPLQEAQKRRHTTIIRLLSIEMKDDKQMGHTTGSVDVCNKGGKEKNPSTKQTGLATESGDLKSVKYNCAKLSEICKTGKLSLVKHIISNGLVDINCQTNNGYTPVMRAVQGRQVKVVEYLVSQGCDLSLTDLFKNTVLHLACLQRIDIAQCLLDSGKCDLESRNFMGQTPVIEAASGGSVEIMKLLVKEGCNIKAVDDFGDTALHAACKHGKVDSVKYLVTLGAAKELSKRKNRFGHTPLQEAQIGRHTTMIGLLKW